MEKLTQELTTAEGFCKVMNDNAAELGTDLKATMIRTEELNDGTVVQVEGMTPDAIKNLFNQQITKVNADETGISFKTPGEPVQVYVDDTVIEPVETELLDGVVQVYNKAIDNSAVTGIKLSLVEGLREGEANVEANATIGTLSIEGTSDEVTYELDDVGDFESFTIDGANLKVGDTPLTAKKYSVTIIATSGEDIESKAFEINVAAAYPEISTFTITPVDGLLEGNPNVAANAVVANMTANGGTEPYTYTLREDGVNGADNASFKVDGTTLKVNETPLTVKDYKVAMTVTDKQGKTKDQNATISVKAPEITALNVAVEEGLTAPLAVDTLVANLTTEGGIAPYTYSIKEENDYAEFKVDGTTIKVATQIDSEGTKNITVVVTDKNNKTKEQATEISIAGAGA